MSEVGVQGGGWKGSLVAGPAIAYPFLVYVSLAHWGTRATALVVLTALLVSLALGRRSAAVLLPASLLIGIALASGRAQALTLLPALSSFAVWAAFQGSLRPGSVPIVERFARRRYAPVPELVRDYCRRVTRVWCGFLLLNGALAAALAFWAPLAWWALYTGLISYALIGLLLLGERFLTRPRVDARLRKESLCGPEGPGRGPALCAPRSGSLE